MREISRRSVALSVVVLLAATPLVAASPSGRAELAEEVIRDVQQVVLVEIPVNVTRKGEPVRGLTREDLEVWDRGRSREIVDFEVVDLLARPTAVDAHDAGAAEPPVAARRHILLVFDQVVSNPHSIERMRRGALELVRHGLHPSDLVGIAAYTYSGVRLVVGFTSDHEQVAEALETLDQQRAPHTVRDPLGIVWADTSEAAGGRFGAFAGDRETTEVVEWLDRSVDLDTSRQRAAEMSSAMTDVARAMAGLNGRKHLFFLSEGFPGTALMGRGVRRADDRAAVQANVEAAIQAGGFSGPASLRYGETEVLGQLERMAEEFVRAGVTVHTFDSAGLRSFGADAAGSRAVDTHDMLFMTADLTGGAFYSGYNRLDLPMERVMEETAVTYLLSIQPEDLELDGAFHRLEVRVKGQGRLHVAHRPGYHAPRPYDAQSEDEKRQMTAGLILGSANGGQVGTRVQTDSLSPADGAVELQIEVDLDSLAPGRSSGSVPAEVYAYALAADGAVRDYFAQSIEVDLTGGAAAGRRDLRLHGTFNLPPGQYTARTLVRNASTGSFGVRSTPFEVAAAAAAPAPDGAS
jgi:VWFA-related protein